MLTKYFYTKVMNDGSTFYLDGGGVVLPMQKSEGFCPGGGVCLRGFCPRGFCPEGVLSYIPRIPWYQTHAK